ncbi:Signal peptidase complex catalytic subunit SEC11 [Mycena venus]|uniref:Signal peptidase complex catalytic subunit SEC11 n=1 Tax=Mycena venus TaxID=2733690 RepID=A0A8H6YBR6_9AGAR|nr:Signal peptidase complex catalytic subunit SEC11 [Mycena venus]
MSTNIPSTDCRRKSQQLANHMWATQARIRQILLQAQAVALSVASVFMLYTALELFTNCKSPIVVVLSGSMEPGIRRGDLIFLSNYAPQKYENGDIIIYQVADEAIPIVHRVVQTHSGPESSSRFFLTKGDNNDVDDIPLYKGLERLESKHIVGKVRGIIPFVGYVSILVNESPRLRYGVFGVIGLLNILRT